MVPVAGAARTVLGRAAQFLPVMESHAHRPEFRKAYAAVLLAFIVELFFTRSAFVGDTYWYMEDIAAYMRGDGGAGPRMWDFGHIAWRPLGWLVTCGISPALQAFGRRPDAAAAGGVLTAISVAATLGCALCLTAFALRATASPAAASLVAIAFLFTNAVLNISRSGASWLPGLFFITMATFITTGDRAKGWLPGFLAGCAVALWIPNLVTLPAILSARLLAPRPPERAPSGRMRAFALQYCAAAAIVIAAAYGLGLFERGITNWQALLHWMKEATHDESRQGRFVRLIFGFPRSFISMGDEGILFKRFLFHDPYAHLTLVDIIRVSLAKVAAFYLALLFLVLGLWKSVTGRRVLVPLLAALFFNAGVAIAFESGSRERYLAIYPFLFLGLAIILRTGGRLWGGATALLCCGMIVENGLSFSAPAVSATKSIQEGRIRLLSTLKPGDGVYIVSNQDGLGVRYQFPLDPELSHMPAVDTIMPVEGRVEQWRSIFAASVLSKWNSGLDVWVTTRVLAERPKLEWNWVEGDDSRISWRGIHEFFHNVEWGGSLGSGDAFQQVKKSERNRALFARLLPQGGMLVQGKP